MQLGFIIFGVLIHLILLYSIFDVYYSSPLVHGAKEYPISKNQGLANRLVFFSAGNFLFI